MTVVTVTSCEIDEMSGGSRSECLLSAGAGTVIDGFVVEALS